MVAWSVLRKVAQKAVGLVSQTGGMRVRQTQVSPGDGVVLLTDSVCKNDAV